jgi:hypothetical protein
MECSTTKDPLEGPFVVVLSTPTTATTVKQAEIVCCIYHNWVKPASLKWEYIPDPASPYKITLWNTRALPWLDSASQETTGDHEWDVISALVTPESDWSWGVIHFTFEDESLPCFFLLIVVSSLQHAHYLNRKCCYQNSDFPHLLFLFRHGCWVMHPQAYHLLSVLSWQSVHLF